MLKSEDVPELESFAIAITETPAEVGSSSRPVVTRIADLAKVGKIYPSFCKDARVRENNAVDLSVTFLMLYGQHATEKTISRPYHDLQPGGKGVGEVARAIHFFLQYKSG